ncbi:MAG: hypothetical protein HWN67_07495 [Candidatus Helarchaeota archaeon]|nr:hypothetical protein [Candidatus Helarchaeota archaeon]
MNKKATVGIFIIIIGGVGVYYGSSMLRAEPPAWWILTIPLPEPTEKWALIVCSDTKFSSDESPTGWAGDEYFVVGGPGQAGEFFFVEFGSCPGEWDPTHGCDLPAHSGPGSANISCGGGPNAGFWTTWDFENLNRGTPFPINDSNYYINVTACINTTNCFGPVSGWETSWDLGSVPGFGAYIGLVWLNSTNHSIGSTFSQNNFIGTNPWTTDTLLALPSVDAPAAAVGFSPVLVQDGLGDSYFDDIKISVKPNPNASTGNIIYDGFPAQAIQAYNACRNYGFDDDHIMMMIDTGDQGVNIHATDSILNDYSYHKNLYPGCYDYEEENVTKANFTREMNVSISGSWASKIKSNDDVLIYMIDHGTFINAADAVFHFVRSGNTINEAEMKALLDNIKCKRLALFVDCCFSGNFIDSLNASNRILVSAAGPNRLSWYWTMAKPQYWAGSWFFHPFWEDLNNGLTIQQAFTNASNYVPWGQANPVAIIQIPMVIDASGLLSSWNPPL